MRCLSPRLHITRRATRSLLRADESSKRSGSHHLWALHGLCRGPGRKKAAQSLPSGFFHPLFRHGRLQPHLQILPELAHEQSAPHGSINGPGVPHADLTDGRASRLQKCRLYLQRPDHLPGICHGYREKLPGAGYPFRGGNLRLHPWEGAQGILQRDRRRQCRSKRVHRRFLQKALQWPAPAHP